MKRHEVKGGYGVFFVNMRTCTQSCVPVCGILRKIQRRYASAVYTTRLRLQKALGVVPNCFLKAAMKADTEE